MKPISDIRVYKSDVPNIDGNPSPSGFTSGAHIKLRRVCMKLREKGFSFGDFDHLYINFTACHVENKMSPAKRSVDRYHPFYRYYDVETDADNFNCPSDTYILDSVKKVLITFFSSEDFTAETVTDCFDTALREGENMTVLIKEKKSAAHTARIYLRLLDSGRFKPLARILGTDGKTVYECDLPETNGLFGYGQIQLNSKTQTMKILPRKNAFTQNDEPIVIDFSGK